MNIKEEIQKLLRELEVYRSHGLFVEAKEKCQALAKLIQKSDRVKNKQKLLNVVAKKVRDLESDARKFEQESASAQTPSGEQKLAKHAPSLATKKKPEPVTLDGATAALLSGQFEKALNEFNELVKLDSYRFVAAKNILRCHLELSSFDDAVMQYNLWFLSDQFTSGGLEKIYAFLKDELQNRGIDEFLPKPEQATDDALDETEEDYIDILSLKIPLDDESQEEKEAVLEVREQEGSMVSVIVSRDYSALIDKLKVGSTLKDVQFHSPSVVFVESCVVSAKNQIKSGPQKGDFNFVIKILNI